MKGQKINKDRPGRVNPDRLAFRPAEGDRYDDFFRMLKDEAEDYLEKSIKAIDLTLPQFRQKFETVGTVFGIYLDDDPVGFYWIESRGEALHIHGLVLKTVFHGRGIGGYVLDEIERKHGGDKKIIELGVYNRNTAALELYKRKGYRTVKSLEEVGFYIMRKNLLRMPQE